MGPIIYGRASNKPFHLEAAATYLGQLPPAPRFLVDLRTNYTMVFAIATYEASYNEVDDQRFGQQLL